MIKFKLRVARRHGQPLSQPTQKRLRLVVDRQGVRTVADRLGIAPNTIARGLAGLGVYPGTAILIEQRLPVLEGEAA